MSDTTTTRNRGGQGPPLLLVAGAATGLFIASLIVGSVLAGVPFPSPFAGETARVTYFAENADATRVSGMLQFAAAVPLAIFASSVHSRLQHLGIRAAGATIALTGGLLASTALASSGLLQWGLSRAGPEGDASVVLVLHDLAFVTGGVAHVVALGLLIAGIAVPALVTGLLPRSVAVIGIVIAAVAEITTLSLLWPELAILLPIARFPGMIWLLVAAIALPTQRHRTTGHTSRTADGQPEVPVATENVQL